MNPWTLRALDVLVALLLVGGIALIWRSLATRHLSFAARVAQGRVSEEAPPQLARWARRAWASALDSLGSTSESVARRLALAGMAPEVGLFRLRQAAAGIAGLILSAWHSRPAPHPPCAPPSFPCARARSWAPSSA